MFQFTAVLKPKGVLGLSFQVGMPSAIQDDGRFFERYEEKELNSIIDSHGYTILTTVVQNTDQNTLNKKQLKRWCNYILSAPEKKEKISLSADKD